MAARGVRPRTIQAWIELRSEDPEATSAADVAARTLAAGRGLQRLRRLRLFELSGPLPARKAIEGLLHRSIQFYNPHKERCWVRTAVRDPVPVAAGEVAILVADREGERRVAAERWWEHQTGERIEVREGTVWVAAFAGGEPLARGGALAVARDRHSGLLCNPNAQWHRVAAGAIPLPWLSAGPEAAPLAAAAHEGDTA